MKEMIKPKSITHIFPLTNLCYWSIKLWCKLFRLSRWWNYCRWRCSCGVQSIKNTFSNLNSNVSFHRRALCPHCVILLTVYLSLARPHAHDRDIWLTERVYISVIITVTVCFRFTGVCWFQGGGAVFQAAGTPSKTAHLLTPTRIQVWKHLSHITQFCDCCSSFCFIFYVCCDV